MKKLAGWLLVVLPLVVAANVKADVQAPSAAIQLVDFDGHPVDFSAVQRDATLLALWSSTCVPCIEEMPLLDALAKNLSGDSQLAVVGVNLDADRDLAAAKKVLAAQKVAYPMLRDPKRQLVRKWFPKNPERVGLPLVLVVDRKFHAAYSQGFKPGTSAEAFIAEWSPQLISARAGKLHEPLRLLTPPKSAPTTPEQMAPMVEKIVRSHHPELSAAEVKIRVDAAMTQFRSKGTFSIE